MTRDDIMVRAALVKKFWIVSVGGLREACPSCTHLNDLVHLLAVLVVCRSHVAFLVIWASVTVWVRV